MSRMSLALLGAVAALAAGCDAGPESDEAKGVGPPIHVISADVSASQPLPADQPIHLAFDRLLLPESVSRQAFLLSGNATPVPSYDPITRIVTLTPITELVAGQTYTLEIATPQSPTDLTGLRAIDGATIDPKSSVIAFQVAAKRGSVTSPPTVDFCTKILPTLGQCVQGPCHGGTLPAAGLNLQSLDLFRQTAIGRVAQGSNHGPQSQAQAPGLRFGEDMPIIDPGTGTSGDPANSYFLYKLLLAKPAAGSGMPAAAVPWQALSDAERTVLGSYVSGREMPFPSMPSSSSVAVGLSLADLTTFSLWIAQGANVPAACGGSSGG